jgi:hypothetical protein
MLSSTDFIALTVRRSYVGHSAAWMSGHQVHNNVGRATWSYCSNKCTTPVWRASRSAWKKIITALPPFRDSTDQETYVNVLISFQKEKKTASELLLT